MGVRERVKAWITFKISLDDALEETRGTAPQVEDVSGEIMC